MHWREIPHDILSRFRSGVVIPAHPLALNASRRFDVQRQRALTRYYIDSGAGGLAVGVHTTQFAIREVGLLQPVLETAAETAASWAGSPLMMIAGVIGRTPQAVAEARLARSLRYHAVLVSLAAFKGASEDELIEHCARIADEMPLMGFYLQPAVGGIPLGRSFWRRLASIDNVIGVKIAPFNRYATLDVIHGVIDARAEQRITLYTGNDDHIVLDLTVPFRTRSGNVHIAGGLLGHWSVWTKTAVDLLKRCHAARDAQSVPRDLLALDSAVTHCNQAFFDVNNSFHGAIAGCHEVLRRQGLLEGCWCLDPAESLGPGQLAAIDEVYRTYPELNDDAFVAANRERWLDA